MGKNYHTELYKLRISDYDTHDTLTPHAVLDIFQDMAGRHSENIGVGYKALLDKHLYWVLMRTKYEVVKPMPLYANVKAITWPKAKGRIDFDREYEIRDANNDDLYVKGVNKWIVINTETRRISSSKDVVYDCDILEKENFPGNFKKLDDFSIENITPYIQKTAYSDLDHNGHINNANYATYILNAIELKKGEEIRSFQIDHIHELEANKEVKIFVKRENKLIFAKGLNENAEISFNSCIELF